jgi:hypothetical protein
MKTQKQFFLYCILSILFLVIHTSCENKRDDSGTLGGMWQLVEWRAADGSIAYNKPDTTLYYKVRSNLLMLQELPGESETYFLTYYQQTEGCLVINPDKIVNNAERDTVLHPIQDLKKYGVPSTGRLQILELTSDKMVLSGEEGTLRFRKY